MGIRSSSQFNKEYQQLIDQFQILQQNINEGLRYLQNKQTKQQFLLREISCHDKDAFLKIQQLFRNKKVQLENNRHVTPLVKMITNSQDQFCMTFFKIYALFEFPQRTLDDEINERGLQKRRFQEKQLWSILASCILGLSHLQKNHIKHSSLRSKTILISHDGIIKIFDPITTGCSSNYDTLLNQRETPHIYISPQQVQGLKEEKLAPQHDPFKSDIWTLGMIILEAGLLSYQDQCYRDQYSRIHWETLQYNINLFQQNYSSQLTNLVEFMLGKDERSRPDWFQLEQHVIKVEEDVRGSTIGGHKKKDSNLYVPPQQPRIIDRPSDQRFFGSDKQMSQSHTPSEINLPPRHQPPSKGITRSRQKSTHTIFTSQPYLQPIKVSDISYTRPFRSIFPASTYINHSQIDQNLVLVQDDDKQFDFDQQRFSIPATMSQLPNNSINNNIVHFSPSQSASMSINHNHPNINSLPLPYLQSNQIVSPPYRVDVQNVPTVQSVRSSPFQVFQTPTQMIQSQVSNRASHDGQFVEEQYKQGSRYEGYKLNGQKHGFGKFYYQDGGLYQGNWKFNKMEGQGKLYYQSNRLAYDGQWHNQQFSGRGTLYNEFPQPLTGSFDYRNFDEIEQFWVKYQGDFFEDMKHGWGILYLSNGQYFEGQFRNDYADGIGTFVNKQGNHIRGRWRNNVME